MQKMLKFYRFSILTLCCLLIFQCRSKDDEEGIKAPKFHMAENVGYWEEQRDDHVPQVKLGPGNFIEVTVPFKGSLKPRHYMEVIALYDEEEREILVRRFELSLLPAFVKFELPDITKTYTVIAKCNTHDMWKTVVPGRGKE